MQLKIKSQHEPVMVNKALKLSALFGLPFLSSKSYQIIVMDRYKETFHNFLVSKLFGINFRINYYQMQFLFLDLKRNRSMPSHLSEFFHLAQ